jgi:hemin uptake protein HemP
MPTQTSRASGQPSGAPVAPDGEDRADTETVVPVGDIMGGRRETVLVHNGVRYRLRITSNDKLILTK